MYTLGEEEGKGAVEDESGLTPIERVRRRVRGLVKMALMNNLETFWKGG